MGKATGTKGDFLRGELSANAAEAAKRFLPLLERGKNEAFAVAMAIGPHDAEFLLASNEDNRKVGASKVLQFSTDMRHGKWKLNGQPIVIARTGELNDGQHRLMAVLATGLTIRMMVSFGVERESRDTIDLNKARSVGDHLTMKGFKYASALAATARAIIAYENANGRGVGFSSAVSAMEQQERVINDALLREITVYVERHKPTFMRTSLTAMAFYVLARIHSDEAKRYIDGVLSGLNLSATDPAYLVRERLMKAKEVERGSGSDRAKKGLTEQGVVEVIFRGWNMFVTGATGTKVQARGTLPALRRPRQSAFVEDTTIVEPAAENIVPYDPTADTAANVKELEAA